MAHRCPRNSSWKCFSASCPTSSRAKRNCASCGARRIHAQNFCKDRSEEHTSELQSQSNLVCRLLLEKKKKHQLHLYVSMISPKLKSRTKSVRILAFRLNLVNLVVLLAHVPNLMRVRDIALNRDAYDV